MVKPYDFAVGQTDPGSFPVDAFKAAALRAIDNEYREITTYPGPLGHRGLRELMARRESEREGVAVSADRIALTNGSMQAVTLAAEACLEPGDNVAITEEFTYPGTLAVYRNLRLDLVGIPVDKDGMRMDQLARSLDELAAAGRPPRFIYTLTNYQNPTGSVMPLERRRELIRLGAEHEVPIVEDNCYGDVHYDGAKVPSIYALDDDPRHIYICSLSKILAPGLRLGYVMADPVTLSRIVAHRNDAGGNYLSAAIVAEYFKRDIWEHCAETNAVFASRRNAIVGAFEEHLDDICIWSKPPGGLFVWLRVPDDVDMTRLRALAGERGVGYQEGANFHYANKPSPYLRLAFGHTPVEIIQEGIPVLARSIREARTSNEPVRYAEQLS